MLSIYDVQIFNPWFYLNVGYISAYKIIEYNQIENKNLVRWTKNWFTLAFDILRRYAFLSFTFQMVVYGE